MNITGDGIDESVEVKGTVTGISSIAQKVTTTSGEETVVGITVAIDKAYPGLKPGLTVTCKVVTDSRKGVVVARYSMLKDGSDGQKSVFLYTKDSTVREVEVKTGIASDLNVEIIEGLNGGEEVILNPPKTLQDGMKVQKAASGGDPGSQGSLLRPGGGGRRPD